MKIEDIIEAKNELRLLTIKPVVIRDNARRDRRAKDRKRVKDVPMNGKFIPLGHGLKGHQRKDFIQIDHTVNLTI